VVVLGCQVFATYPSIALQNRVHVAGVYLQEHQSTKVVASGGQGHGEDISEAEAIKRLLTNRYGITEDRIFMEDKSTSTIENLRFSNDLFKLSDKNIIIATSDFHIFRAVKVAKKLGYENVEGMASRSRRSLLPSFLLREYFSIMYYFLTRKI
jgi:uncharacterized SAM-binding protein YcdF (DUF218 family)